MNELFRDDAQRQAVCDRLLEFAHYDARTERFATPSLIDPDRVRRARLLYDFALTLFDGDSQVELDQLVSLDGDTRGVLGDLLMDLGMQDFGHVDRWLENTRAFFRAEEQREP